MGLMVYGENAFHNVSTALPTTTPSTATILPQNDEKGAPTLVPDASEKTLEAVPN